MTNGLGPPSSLTELRFGGFYRRIGRKALTRRALIGEEGGVSCSWAGPGELRENTLSYTGKWQLGLVDRCDLVSPSSFPSVPKRASADGRVPHPPLESH